jgi:hypothetical protein
MPDSLDFSDGSIIDEFSDSFSGGWEDERDLDSDDEAEESNRNDDLINMLEGDW